jgi:predicted alpha/beta hydrolase
MEALPQDSLAPKPHDLTISARDGYPLAATLYPADGAALLVINSATGTPRGYYRAFARYAAGRGIATVTYDYRGVGGSRPAGALRRLQATMRDWAELDASAVLEWALRAFPGRRLLVVGHSFGGQCLGLLPQAARIERVALVASQIGYWRGLAPRDRLPAWFAMHLLIPGLSRPLGYFPASKVGLGEDLPKGVALEWARWCRSPNYLFDHLTAAEHAAYQAFRAPIVSYKVSDDSFASGDAVERLLAFYPQSRPLLRTVTPEEMGLPALGHFGPFRSALRERLWPELVDWLEHGSVPPLARAVV